MQAVFIDYITLILITVATGLVVLACYVYWDLDGPNQRRWAPPFLVVGGLATAAGLHMAFTWPLPGSYNAIYGETTVLIGLLFLGAALAVAKGWDLLPLTIFALFAGVDAILAGVGIIYIETAGSRWVAVLGFIVTGVAGVLALPAWLLRTKRAVRLAGALTLLLAALIWFTTTYMAFWMHMEMMKTWQPTTALVRQGGQGGGQ